MSVDRAALNGNGTHGTRLVLFDIDGTLLLTDGAGRRAIHRALVEVFGGTGPTDHWFDGKTDPQIVREVMRLAGRSDAHIDERMQASLDRYVELLDEELRDPNYEPHVMPGVLQLLDALEARSDVLLGLLTGNLASGARAKLEAVGIAHARFAVGAYGSDHELRPELPAIAQRRTREACGVDVLGENVVVIGDTPADMECGRGIGARAIGVATGRFSTTALASAGAHSVFETLEGTDAVLDAICSRSN